MNILDKVRPNIRSLKAYSTARDEFSGDANVFLDANENAFGSVAEGHWNRYPDPHQQALKKKLAHIKNVPSEDIFLGNGSDEAIDLLFRAFCEPGQDRVLLMEPSYGMYRVCADVNNVVVDTFLLNENFSFTAKRALEKKLPSCKLVILCSPNNPSANSLNRTEIEILVQNFDGPIIVDEAYIDFCQDKTILPLVKKYENLVVLQTFSKAWGMAGVRLGMAFGSPEVIDVLDRIKYPYNINEMTQQLALEALDSPGAVHEMVRNILEQRTWLEAELEKLFVVKKVFPSDANFFLVRFENGSDIFHYLQKKGIIVRDRSKLPLCENCLRITVGTAFENKELINALKNY